MQRSASIVSLLGLLIFLGASQWLARLERSGPAQSPVMLDGGVPATFYLPPAVTEKEGREAFLDPPARGTAPPAVVVMHGFAGDRASMSGISRRLAAGGYAVLSIEARGHGANRNPLQGGWAQPDRFAPDLRAAVDFLRASPFVDGQRIAVLGHSMGAGAALDFASRESGIDAAVMISGGWTLQGPYRPANALFVFAAGDPPFIKQRSRRLAEGLISAPDPATLERLANGEVVGDPTTRDALRVIEIAGTDHQGIVWTEAALREILGWLDSAFDRTGERGEVPGDPRIPAWLLVLFGFLLTLPGLGFLVGRFVPGSAALAETGRWAGLAALALAFLATMPLLATGIPTTILSIEVGDAIAAQFALAGIALLGWIGLREPQRLRAVFADWPHSLLGAGLGVMAVFVLMQPVSIPLHALAFTPERLAVFALTTLSFLPLALGHALLLRRGPTGSATVYALLGRCVILVSLVVGIALGVLGYVMVFMLPALAVVALCFEAMAAGIHVRSRNLLAIALIDAAWLSMVTASIMPVRV